MSSQRNFGAAFAIVVGPGAVLLRRGRRRGRIGPRARGGVAGDPWSSWLNPTSILGGVLAVVVCAYLAAVYLVWDAAPFRRSRHGRVLPPTRRDRRDRGRRRRDSPGSSCSTTDAEYLFDNLITGRALPLVIVSAHLRDRIPRPAAPPATIAARGCSPSGAVVAVIWGWGVAQWPYLLPETLKVSAGAAPDATLWSVLIVFVRRGAS